MPNYDGTGPLGRGPKTGRNRGFCSQDRQDPIQMKPWIQIAGQILAGVIHVFQNRQVKAHSQRQIENR